MIFILFFQIEYQAVNRVQNDGAQELVLYLNIPERKLQYISREKDFLASYEIQVTVYDEQTNQLTGDYWRRTVLNDTADIVDSVKISIPRKSEFFVLKILDLHGGEIFKSTQRLIQVKNVANIFWSVKEDTLRLTFTVFNQQDNIDSIAATIADSKSVVKARRGTYPDSIEFDVAGLPIDGYDLKLDVYGNAGKIDESIIPIKISRPFYLDDNIWFTKVDQLQYIATPSEMNVLKQADVEQRDSLWVAFWKNFDPTPNTAYNEKEIEYYERIAYAEERFANGDRGWRSDRARVFVRYGPPDEIQSFPYELDSFPYEVWLYYKNNLRFVFVDRYGFGQYLLVNRDGLGI
ncbi:MAG: GWxTD domain-containing protein [candidate division WOR-3 bacterium]|nr:MAG: GWxTD domain-containing protein [candidate division WOR-3 bacterium]